MKALRIITIVVLGLIGLELSPFHPYEFALAAATTSSNSVDDLPVVGPPVIGRAGGKYIRAEGEVAVWVVLGVVARVAPYTRTEHLVSI